MKTINLSTDDYYLDIYADSFVGTDINNVNFTEIGNGTWRVNSTESDYNTSRGQVIKTLFYGGDTYEPRILNFTNIDRINSQDIRDNNTNAFFFKFTRSSAASGFSETHAFFTNIIDNYVSSWVKLSVGGAPDQTTIIRYLSPSYSTSSNVLRFAQNADAGGPTSNITMGTNLSDEYTNRLNFSVFSLASTNEASSGEFIFLSKDTIENITDFDDPWSTKQLVYFNENHSIPPMEYQAEDNFTITLEYNVTSSLNWSCQICTASTCENADENRSIFLDLFNPIVNITFPEETSYIINVSDANYTVIESLPDKCWYNLNSQANSTPVNSGVNFTDLNSTIGENNLIVYCNDTRNNLGSDSVTYTLDAIRYSSDSGPTNTSTTGVGDTYINVTINPIVELGNITYRGYNLTNTTITEYLSDIFYDLTTNDTLTSTTDPFYWDVLLYDNISGFHALDLRYKGNEIINLTLEGFDINIDVELNTSINVSAFSNIYNVSIDIDYLGYGDNYSTGFLSTQVDLLIQYFIRNNFIGEIIEFILDSNNSFLLDFHKYDSINSVTFNMSTSNNISTIKIYSPLDNSIYRLFDGILKSNILTMDKFYDPTTLNFTDYKLFSYDNLGEKFFYILFDDETQLVNFQFNILGQQYGFEYVDTTFNNTDEVLTDATVFMGSILSNTTLPINSVFETFNSALNTTSWSITSDVSPTGTNTQLDTTITNTVSGGKLTMYSKLLNDLDPDESDTRNIDNELSIINTTYFNYWSSEDTQLRLDYSITAGEEETCGETEGYISLYSPDVEIWRSIEIDTCETAAATSSTNELIFNLTRDYESDKVWVNITGVETSTQHSGDLCGIVTITRDWTNGIQSVNFSVPNCEDAIGNLTTPSFNAFGDLDNQFKLSTYIKGDATRTSSSSQCIGNGAFFDPGCPEEVYENVTYNICRCYQAGSEPTCELFDVLAEVGSCSWVTGSYSYGTEDISATINAYEINRTLSDVQNSTYFTNSVFDSAVDITTMIAYIFGKGVLNTQISTDDGDNYQEILPNGVTMPILNPGKHVKFKGLFFDDEDYSANVPIITNIRLETPQSYSENFSIDIGNDDIIDYQFNGTFNSNVLVTLSDINISDFFLGTSDLSSHSSYIPISVSSDSAGILNFTSTNTTHEIRDISLNETELNTFLAENSNSTIPINVTAIFNGNDLTIDGLIINYLGGNSTVEILAHNLDYSKIDFLNITYYYSRWDYEWGPPGVEWLYFPATSYTDTNVQPYGQTSTQPIWNITNYGYGGRNATLSLYLNDSVDCVNTTLSLDGNKSNGFFVNESWVNITTLEYLETADIYLWADFECNYSQWVVFQPVYTFRQCANETICSEEVI